MMKRDEFLVRSGLRVETLELWLAQSWLVPDASGTEAAYAEIDVARAHFIRDLQGDLGVNDEGVDVVLHLVDQLHGLRRALALLQDERRGGA